MLMAIDHRYTQIMLEQIFAQNELILEVLAPTLKDASWLKSEMERMNQELGFTDMVVAVHEKDLRKHDRRVRTLEAA